MERATLARPYAEALAKLAAASQQWQIWSERLALLSAITADDQLVALAGNPAVPGKRVAEVIIAVSAGKLGGEGENLVQLLAENKRLGFLADIASQFEAMKASQEGLLEAHVTTAFALSDTQMSGLMAKLEAKFGRKISATQSTDPELIGGVVIQVGDEVMDASVRGGLSGLAATLKA